MVSRPIPTMDVDENDLCFECDECGHVFYRSLDRTFKKTVKAINKDECGTWLCASCPECRTLCKNPYEVKYKRGRWNAPMEVPTVRVPGTPNKIRKRARHTDIGPADLKDVLEEEKKIRAQREADDEVDNESEASDG